MKAVLDTNVFISGIHWSGACENILRAWFLNNFTLVSSQSIVEELSRTLKAFKIPLDDEDIHWWANTIIEKSIIVVPKQKVNAVKENPDDNKFIEAAGEGNADYIVSQDKHLLKIKQYENIKIVTPEEFLKVIEEVR